jgi:cytoskeletal protein RodZ
MKQDLPNALLMIGGSVATLWFLAHLLSNKRSPLSPSMSPEERDKAWADHEQQKADRKERKRRQRKTSLKALLIMLIIWGALAMLGPVIGGTIAIVLGATFLILVIAAWGNQS